MNNFRNYEELNLEFNSNKVLLIGKNAQGKTNILEAIHYLSCLQALNAGHDSELITWGKDFSNIKAEITKECVETELEVILNPPKKKILKVNGLKKTKTSEFTSQLSVVCFSVTDLLLLRGVPDDRRSWLDVAIGQLYPAYSDRLSKYNKIRIQKNNYLKALKNNMQFDEKLFSVWNEQLVTAGSNIIYLRIKFLKELQKIAAIKHSEISNNENLRIDYNSTVISDFNCISDAIISIENIAAEFEQKLAEREQEEIIRAQSLVGPHRDDISYFINDVEAKKFASQGQQRTIVLALKLAELALIEKQFGESPVLLLDDVLAELDDLRQNYLLNSIEQNTQTIITSVDTLHFKEEYLQDVELFKIVNGAVESLKWNHRL